MKIETRVDLNRIRANGNGPVLLQVRMTAPEVREEARQAESIVVALDTSVSMQGAAFEDAKRFVGEMVRHLSNGTRFGLATFDECAECVHGVSEVGDRGGLGAFVRPMELGGKGSNAISAWLCAREELRGGGKIVLVSDGQFTDDLGRLIGIVEEGRRNGIVTSTVAVGEVANVGLLEALAMAGGGRFHRLHGESQFQIVADELGGLRPVEAYHGRVRLKGGYFCEGIEPLGFEAAKENGWVEVCAGDFVSGEEKTVCFNLTVPVLPCVEGEPIATLENEALAEVEVVYSEVAEKGIVSRRFVQTIYAQAEQPEGESSETSPVLTVAP